MADSYDVTKDYYAVEVRPGSDRPTRLPLALTPSDTRDVTNPAGDNAPCYAKALYIGVSGDVTLIGAADKSNNLAGTPVTYKAAPVGFFPVQTRRVMATGTTASSIVGQYDQ